MNSRQKFPRAQAGFSMIEVLVALVILLIGLLGLAGLMAQSQRSEMESYQRVQALIMLRDMQARIEANRMVALCYASSTTGVTYFGTGTSWTEPATPWTTCINSTASLFAQYYVNYNSVTYPTVAAGTTQAKADATNQSLTAISDMTAWNNTLLGAAEAAAGNNVGGMLNARGCITYDSTTELTALNGNTLTGTGIFTVSVAWQGLSGTTANTTLTCGQNLYLNAQGAVDDSLRRVVSLNFRIGSVDNLQ